MLGNKLFMRRTLVAMLSSLGILTATVYGAEGRAQSKALIGSVPGVSAAPSAEAMKDGAGLIDRWLKASEAYASYEFEYNMTVYKPNGPVTEIGHLYYKKPHLLKIEETSGPKKGSVAILGKNGKVRAHGGGGLRFFNVDLSPDSGYLKSANGWPMVKSDFISLAEAVKGYIAEGDSAKESEPMAVPGKSEKLVLFELFKGGPNGVLFKRAYFDPNTNLPVEWWDYVDGKLWAHSVWTNFKTTELSDATFTMKGKEDN